MTQGTRLANDVDALPALETQLVAEINWEFSDLIRYDSATGRRAAWRIKSGVAKGMLGEAQVADQGGELLILRPDGTLELDSRMMWRLADGRLIYWRARGVVNANPEDAGRFFADGHLPPQPLRLTPYFDTTPDDLSWLTRNVFVAAGELSHEGAALRLYMIGGEHDR